MEDQDALYLWLGSSLVLASCALFLWRLRRWLCAPGRATVLGTLRRWGARLRNMLFPECPGGPNHAKVREIEQARCVRKMRAVFRVLHVVYTADTLVWVLEYMVLGAAAYAGGPMEAALAVLAGHLLCLMLDVLPGLVTFHSLRAMVLAALAAHIATLVVQDWGELTCTQYAAFSILVRMVFAILYTDFAMNVAMNVACFLVSYAVSQYLGVIELESIGLVLILAAATVNKSIGAAEINATLEATTSRNFLDAMVALLSNVCDVVLHLSNDFRITQPSPRFAAMLFKSSPHALKGDLILDFVSDAGEANRVLAFLNRADRTAAVLHTCFKDSNNTAVQVQLFHARGTDINGQAFHVVGILENADAQRPLPVPASGEQLAVALAPLADTIREGHVSPAPSCDSLSSGHGELGATYVWVDPNTDGILIVQSSTGFAALGGPPPGANFLDAVHNKRDFLQYMQDRHAQHDHADVGRATRSKLVFAVKRGGSSLRQVSANIRKEVVQQDGKPIVKLAIWNVRNLKPYQAESPDEPGSPGAPEGDWRPPLWREQGSSTRPSRSRADGPRMDEENFCAVVANVLDERWAILDVACFGHAPDFGLEAEGGLLDSFVSPVNAKLAILGSLMHTEDLREIRGLLESDSVVVEEYVSCFRPTEIGRLVMCQPGGGGEASTRTVEVVVLSFFTCGAGAELCCAMALSEAR